jgi:hypothetical protein
MKDKEITIKVVRIHRFVLTVTLALIGGATLFFLTALLLLKGGEPVGPHLNLLGEYLPGYSVSWIGSIIGFLWGAAIGGTLGWIFGSVYNRIVAIQKK